MCAGICLAPRTPHSVFYDYLPEPSLIPPSRRHAGKSGRHKSKEKRESCKQQWGEGKRGKKPQQSATVTNPMVDYFPLTANPDVFYSSYSAAIRQQVFINRIVASYTFYPFNVWTFNASSTAAVICHPLTIRSLTDFSLLKFTRACVFYLWLVWSTCTRDLFHFQFIFVDRPQCKQSRCTKLTNSAWPVGFENSTACAIKQFCRHLIKLVCVIEPRTVPLYAIQPNVRGRPFPHPLRIISTPLRRLSEVWFTKDVGNDDNV